MRINYTLGSDLFDPIAGALPAAGGAWVGDLAALFDVAAVAPRAGASRASATTATSAALPAADALFAPEPASTVIDLAPIVGVVSAIDDVSAFGNGDLFRVAGEEAYHHAKTAGTGLFLAVSGSAGYEAQPIVDLPIIG